MPRRIAVTLVTSLLWTAIAAQAQDWRGGIDSRIELMSILFRLAGNNEYHQCRAPAYDKAIESYFAPYRDHAAVRSARSLAIGFDAPMKLAANLRDAASLAERVPFDGPAVHLYQGWDAAKARDFLGAARQFASDTIFQDFLKSQQALYAATNARLESFLQQADLAWLARFFGSHSPARFVIVPGLANGASSYAARVTDESGTQEIYAIPGVSKVDADGLPVFDSDWRTTMVHELAHAYTNPAAGKFAGRMEKPVRQIYEAVAPAMQRQSYGNWRTMLNESLARAATIQYVMEHDGQEAAQRVIRQENSRSFFWMSGLVKLLDTYRNDRQQYATFESFMPQVAEFFENLAPRIHELTDRLQPKVVSTSIADGATGVDPGVKSIVVHFSMPMSQVGPDKSAKLSGGRFDETGTVVTIPVTLEPQRDYVLPLRWAGGQAFLSADGVPLPATMLRFRTGTASTPPAQ
jgi:hypothetical protein